MNIATRVWPIGDKWPHYALLLAGLLLVLPLWLVQTPAMPDYPAHVAGFHMLAHAGQSEAWEQYYTIHWLFVPNLASELIVPPLAQIMPVEIATKIFLSLAVLMWVLGPALVQRALFGTVSPLPLMGAFFAYNAPFLWGFFNFYFAAGLSFLLLAAWISLAQKRHAGVLAGFAVALLFLYACHLFALLALLLLIGCFEISRAVEAHATTPVALARRALPVLIVALPAALAFLFLRPVGGDDSTLLFDILDTLEDRFAAAVEYYFEGPALTLTGVLCGFWLAGVLSGFIRVHKLMVLPVVVLAIAALLSPEWAMGGWGGHLRLPAMLGALSFGCAQLNLTVRRAKIMAAITGVFLLISVGWLWQDWSDYDRQFAPFREDLATLPKGARIVTVLDSNAMNDASDQPFWHLAEFAIASRGAFTPLMFTTKGQHVIQLKPPYDKYAAATAQQGSPPDVNELGYLSEGRVDLDPEIDDYYPYLKYFQCHFDIAVVIRNEESDADDVSPVPKFMSLRKTGSFYTFYNIHPTKECARR